MEFRGAHVVVSPIPGGGVAVEEEEEDEVTIIMVEIESQQQTEKKGMVVRKVMRTTQLAVVNNMVNFAAIF